MCVWGVRVGRRRRGGPRGLPATRAHTPHIPHHATSRYAQQPPGLGAALSPFHERAAAAANAAAAAAAAAAVVYVMEWRRGGQRHLAEGPVNFDSCLLGVEGKRN